MVLEELLELAKRDVQAAREQLAAQMDAFVSKEWILRVIFKNTPAEIEQIMKQMEGA